MRAAKGYYSLIQYCPDRGRAEAVNVGVALFCPDHRFLDARVATATARAARLFGRESFDLRRLKAAMHAIASRLRHDRDDFRKLEDLEQFIATRANELLLTPPRPMKVEDPEHELNELFEDLVGGQAHRHKARDPVFLELDHALRSPSLSHRVRFDERIPIPILGKTLRIPYAYQNGELNLVKPHSFSSDEGHAINTAVQLAIDGDLLHRYPDPEASRQRLVVIPHFPQAINGAEQRISDLFDKYQVRLVPESSIPQLVAEIEQQAR